MALVLGEAKYNETKKLLESGLYNREEIAQKVHMSHTIVSRVNGTKDYQDYLQQFNQLHKLDFDKHKPAVNNTVKKATVKRTTKTTTKKPTVRKPEPKKSVFTKIKEFFS